MDRTARRRPSRAVLPAPDLPGRDLWLLGATEPLRHPAAPGMPTCSRRSRPGCWSAVPPGSTLISAAALVEATTAGRVRATAWVGCPRSLRRVLLAGLGRRAGERSPRPDSGLRDCLSVGQRAPAGRPAASGIRGCPCRHDPLAGCSRSQSPLVVRPARRHPLASRRRAAAPLRVRRRGGAAGRAHAPAATASSSAPDPDLIRPGQRLAVPRATTPVGLSSPNPPTDKENR